MVPVSCVQVMRDIGLLESQDCSQDTTMDISKDLIDTSNFKELTVDFREDLETYYVMEQKEASSFTMIIWDLKQSTYEVWSTLRDILGQGAKGLYRGG